MSYRKQAELDQVMQKIQAGLASPNKIRAIVAVRSALGCGLTEARDFVDRYAEKLDELREIIAQNWGLSISQKKVFSAPDLFFEILGNVSPDKIIKFLDEIRREIEEPHTK